MELVKQNPYRVVGVWAGADQRTIKKQKARIKALQNVGKSVQFDTDLNWIGGIDRSETAIEKAFSNIEINQNKLFDSFFWFSNGNHIDETALNYLKSGDVNKAKQIWEKLTHLKNVSENNFTAFNNLGTLKLIEAYSNGFVNLELFNEGIQLKTQLITSDKFTDFCFLVADETYTVNQNEELERFIDSIIEGSKKLNETAKKKIPRLLLRISPAVRDIVTEKLTRGPINNIERLVENTKKERSEYPHCGIDIGMELYEETYKDITILSEYFGLDDLKYKMISDNLAKEILQCGIDHFFEFRDEEDSYGGDLGKDVMKLVRISETIAIGTQTKERINENISGLQEWIDNKEERIKQKEIEEDLDFITSQLDEFKNLPNSLENADDLVETCKPILENLEMELGTNDELYLKISSAVVNYSHSMIVRVVNQEQRIYSLQMGYSGELRNKIEYALEVSDKLDTFGMTPELRKNYERNHNTLKSIVNKLSGRDYSATISTNRESKSRLINSYKHPNTSSNRLERTTSSNKSQKDYSGCYIFVGAALVILILYFTGIFGGNFSENIPKDASTKNNNEIENYSSSNNNSEIKNYEDRLKEYQDLSEKKFEEFEKINPIEFDDETNKKVKKESPFKGNQLPNGTSPYDGYFGKGIYNQKYNNWIKFENGDTYDAVVCLVNVTNERTIRNEYIQAGSTFKMTSIPNGTYYIKIFYGKDWNPNKKMKNGKIKGGFETNFHFSKSDNYDDWLKLRDNGYRYSTYTVTLYSFYNGNMTQQNINENEFF